MLKDDVKLSKRRAWLIRLVGVVICASSSIELTRAILTTHFELGASRRHLVFDLQYGGMHYAAGLVMLAAVTILGLLLTLMDVFQSEPARRRYRIACNVAGGFAIAAILCAYVAQVSRFH